VNPVVDRVETAHQRRIAEEVLAATPAAEARQIHQGRPWTVTCEPLERGLEYTGSSTMRARVGIAAGEDLEVKFEQVLIVRERHQAKLTLGLTALIERRRDLHGVTPLAELLFERVLWCA
jgi:hypothetical protein